MMYFIYRKFCNLYSIATTIQYMMVSKCSLTSDISCRGNFTALCSAAAWALAAPVGSQVIVRHRVSVAGQALTFACHESIKQVYY